jgi:hypothetical protein
MPVDPEVSFASSRHSYNVAAAGVKLCTVRTSASVARPVRWGRERRQDRHRDRVFVKDFVRKRGIKESRIRGVECAGKTSKRKGEKRSMQPERGLAGTPGWPKYLPKPLPKALPKALPKTLSKALPKALPKSGGNGIGEIHQCLITNY